MATSITRPMTFAEFERLDAPERGRYELRHGDLTTLPPPLLKHTLLQARLRDLLQQAAGARGRAFVEFGFRALPEGEFRIADVACTTVERLDRQDNEGYFDGAPELVVEILSASNTAVEMLDRRYLCLGNGSRAFWVVDMALKQVDVSTPDGHTMTYQTGQEIPLFFGGHLAVDAIFG